MMPIDDWRLTIDELTTLSDRASVVGQTLASRDPFGGARRKKAGNRVGGAEIRVG
jgi:hypothetical protein